MYVRNPPGIRTPTIMRSRLILEAASELVADPAWEDKQIEVRFRPQGGDKWRLCFFASDAPNAIDAVVSGEADIAICNPGGVLAMARNGAAPFEKPLPLAAIMVLPQFDQLAFAVSGKTGLTSIAQIRDRKYPLKISLRGQRDHALHLVTNLVLSTYGFSLDDIVAWGGELRYHDDLPATSNRIGAVERGEADALFDEALNSWGAHALDMGMRFLPVDEPQLQQIEAWGIQRVAITPEEYPALADTVWTVDFSGWPVFTLESASDDMVAAFCAAIDARKDKVPWYGVGPMRLDLMCSGPPEAPMTIPLHPAAERYWREHGYLK